MLGRWKDLHLPCCTPDPNTWPACLLHMRRGRGCECWRPRRAQCWCVLSARVSASRWTGPRSVKVGNTVFSKMRWDTNQSSRDLEEDFLSSVLKIWINIFKKMNILNMFAQRWMSRELTLMVLSADPVTNHWFPGSTAMDLTQPRWPLMTCHRK